MNKISFSLWAEKNGWAKNGSFWWKNLNSKSEAELQRMYRVEIDAKKAHRTLPVLAELP